MSNYPPRVLLSSPDGLPRTATVGVLGGGQLGRMMALAAGNMDVKLVVLDPTEPSAPAAIAATQQKGSFRDAEAIEALAAQCDVLTVEIEHVDVDALEAVANKMNIEVQPSPFTLRYVHSATLSSPSPLYAKRGTLFAAPRFLVRHPRHRGAWCYDVSDYQQRIITLPTIPVDSFAWNIRGLTRQSLCENEVGAKSGVVAGWIYIYIDHLNHPRNRYCLDI